MAPWFAAPKASKSSLRSSTTHWGNSSISEEGGGTGFVQFTKLRLSGFKSFVDHTELPIEKGLTAVVGPNGCGKSNLLEGLRWVMGETSAKQMRGEGMEDVIFNGTSSRPPRNVADVHLVLDNRHRTAPGLFNQHDTLEISRRIERNGGSQYRLNGAEMRARDIQLLFADLASGARSTALVSQGRIGAIIAAKPIQRRVLLEEAAGITGLHTRRHEAELRLRAAETNLDRLEDVIRTMEAQFESLRRQARQANRYRGLSDQIRTAEAVILAIRWDQAIDDLDRIRTRLDDTERVVQEKTAAAAQAATEQADAAARLPNMREREAVASAVLQRLITTREGLEAEEKRVKAAQEDFSLRIAQMEADRARENQRVREAELLFNELANERDGLQGEQQAEAEAIDAAGAEVRDHQETVTALDSRLHGLTEEMAAAEARRTGLQRRRDELTRRVQALEQRHATLSRQRQELEGQAVASDALRQMDDTVETLVAQANAGREAVDAAEGARNGQRDILDQATQILRDAESTLSQWQTESRTLTRLLESENPGPWPALVDSLTVEPGFETALGAALGDDLSGALDGQAPRHWRDLPPLPDADPLPTGTTPLSRYVTGVAALGRRLERIGVLDDGADGAALAEFLRPGQRLITRDGALWRWDGYVVKADAPSAAALRLQQRNRIAELASLIADAQGEVTTAREAHDRAKLALDQAGAEEKSRRQALRETETALTAAREEQARLHRRAAEQASRLASLAETMETVDGEMVEARTLAEEATAEWEALSDPGAARTAVAELREKLTAARARLTEAQNRVAGLTRDAENRRRRLEVIGREQAGWTERKNTALQQIGSFDERLAAAQAELNKLTDRPAEIMTERSALMEKLETAEADRRQAADDLVLAEAGMREADGRLKAAEQALAGTREERVRAEAAVEQGRLACRSIAERISERFDCVPEKVRDAAGLEPDAALPDRDTVERRLERLTRERDGMGPVNLRAEQEAMELEKQIGAMIGEREDLIKAIEKLRQAIHELNREGRERLLASFTEVDKHFRDLFSRLFGGGDAHLQLTETDDPLSAGLEIIASPPGKRPQVLSLLSGGEQALTALGLLFAVFLTNPAPICVLDEVDAPLDDANVDRFCTLLEEMSASGRTRFLLITHHRMTMARMDRLFGVTMTERGVSQLVSVDLRQAVSLTDE